MSLNSLQIGRFAGGVQVQVPPTDVTLVHIVPGKCQKASTLIMLNREQLNYIE